MKILDNIKWLFSKQIKYIETCYEYKYCKRLDRIANYCEKLREQYSHQKYFLVFYEHAYTKCRGCTYKKDNIYTFKEKLEIIIKEIFRCA